MKCYVLIFILGAVQQFAWVLEYIFDYSNIDEEVFMKTIKENMHA